VLEKTKNAGAEKGDIANGENGKHRGHKQRQAFFWRRRQRGATQRSQHKGQ